MPATLKDVASAAGVHPGTVSRALNPETAHLVSATTVTRVKRAADRLGYVPNPIARSLRTSKSAILGALIPDITNPLFPPVLRGFEDVVSQRGYRVLIANTDNDPDRAARQIQGLRARQAEGMLIATSRLDDPAVVELQQGGTPSVLVNRVVGGTPVASVVGDDVSGIRQALLHLRELGHRRVGHIAGPADTSTGIARMRAFRQEAADLGLDTDPLLVVEDMGYHIASGREALATLLDRTKVSAVIAGNDLIAMGCLDELRARGLSCPADLSVVGFNDIPFVERLDPPLTTVRVPHYELGWESGSLLLDLLKQQEAGQDLTLKSVVLPTSLEVRGSTAGPPADLT